MSMCHSWLMFPEIMSQLWPMGSPYMFCSVLDCLTNEVPQVQWSSVTPPDGGSGSVSAPSEVDSFLAEINKLATTSLELARSAHARPRRASRQPTPTPCRELLEHLGHLLV